VFLEFGFGAVENNSLRLLLQERFSGFYLDGDLNQARRFNRLGGFFPGVANRCKAAQAFLTRENINEIVGKSCTGEITLLGVDVDGMDYYLWEALTCVSPRVVVVEFNSSFGPDRSVTVPYEPEFDRTKKHRLGFYHGASLAALEKLGWRKGYALVGTDSKGCNAFFVRRDLLKAPLQEIGSVEAYHPHASRIARGYAVEDQWAEISTLPLVNV
jgi:hypothetical protein